MKLPFRQGIVNYQVDGFGNPQFLQASSTPGYVALNVSPTPCVVTFAHGASNYLQVFASDVAAAWGPIPPVVTSHLYWDIDLLTSEVTYGLTTIEPVASATEPASPPAPTATAVFHWFDTASATMKIWTGAKWRNVVRAFAGRVAGTTTSIIAEPRNQAWRGALPVESRSGYIATDIFGNPLRTPAGEFVTTATPIRFNNTVGTTGVLAVLPNAYVPVRASENIPAMSLVYFSGEGTVGLASGNAAVIPARIPIGVVQDELSLNEVGVVTQSGEITSDAWNWSAHIGKPLYCGDNGEIVVNRPVGLLAYRIGFVKDSKTILFQVDAETLPQVYTAGSTSVLVNGLSPISSAFSVNGLGESVWTVSMAPATTIAPGYMTTAQVTALSDLNTRLTTAEADILGRALLVHSHTIPDVTGLQTALDGKSNVGHLHDDRYSLLTHNHDGVYAPVDHSHTIPDVAGLQVALNGKSDVGHGHVIADVAGLVSALALKLDVPAPTVDGNLPVFTTGGQLIDSGFAPGAFALFNHTHLISQVSGLQAVLDTKAELVHQHNVNNLLPTGQDGQVVTMLGATTVGWADPQVPRIDEFTASFDGFTVLPTNVRTQAKQAAGTTTKAFIQVFVNGILQMEGPTKSYTVTGANEITFNAPGLYLNDEIVIYSFLPHGSSV